MAFVIGAQFALSVIPGVELVTVSFVAYAYVFGYRRGMVAATAFSLLRQLVFGIFPTVLLLYLIYYNALVCVFGLLGEKKESDARRVSAFSFYGAMAVAAVYSLVCFLFTEPLARLLGASDNTVGYASSYLRWVVVIGGIPSTLGLTMSHLLRSAGYSRESGTGLAIGGISNILLDPLFMFVILPPGNEVTGAAIATLLSNIISLLYFLFIYHRLKEKSVLTLSPKAAQIEKKLIRAILSIGLPSALTTLLANITSIVKNNLTAGYGDVELAAYGIVMKADMLPLNIGMGLCQGMMPLVAYNYAAKNYPRMKSFTRAAQIAGMTTACVFIAVFELLAPQIIWLFIRDEATIAYGTAFLRIACLATPFMIANFQKVFCLQAMGKGKESLLLGVCRQGLFAIPILLLMNHFVGLYGVVAAQLISDSFTFILATLVYRRIYKQLVDNIQK